MSHQPGILAWQPLVARALTFDIDPGYDPRPALQRVADTTADAVIGLGLPLVLALGKAIPGLRAFPAVAGPGCAFPSTQGALWAYLGAESESELHDRAAAVRARLGEGFTMRDEVRCFRYRDGRDLSGYVDGTANPTGAGALEAAIVTDRGAGLDGSSFVAVQRWVHTLSRLRAKQEAERDRVIGRRFSDNEEMGDAPASAHVKRAEQEVYDPPAFMLRRSMPYAAPSEEGLYFVAYGESLDRFERVLRRMAGAEDGVTDALLTFTRAMTGGYYWCPPVTGEQLDLSRLL